MYIIGRTQMIDVPELETRITTLSQAGFQGVELCLENLKFEPLGLTTEDIAGAVRLLSDLNLRWNSLSFHQDYVHNDQRYSQTLEAIPLAAQIDSKVLVISGGKATDPSQSGNTTTEDWAVLVERTKKLCKVAEDAGVKLALEFEPGFIVDSTTSSLAFFDAVDSPALGANLDLGHAFLQDSDPVESVRLLGSRIYHCHIEDMKTGVHNHLPIGEGDMDIPALLAELRSVGFDGGLALDMYRGTYVDIARAGIPTLQGWL